MNKIYITFEQIADIVAQLKTSVESQGFDAIVGVTRGGLIPATMLSHQLDIPLYPVTITTRHSWDTQPDLEVSHLIEKLAQHKKILVVDDIADTGLTLSLLKKYIDQHGKTSKYATIIAKTQSAFTPDFCGVVESSEAWIVFPWELQ